MVADPTRQPPRKIRGLNAAACRAAVTGYGWSRGLLMTGNHATRVLRTRRWSAAASQREAEMGDG